MGTETEAATASLSSFRSKLEARVASIDSLLCIGLDPHETELKVSANATNEEKADAAFTFCKTLIDATIPYAACYKPNAAFFEALGAPGVAALERLCRRTTTAVMIPADIPIVLDVKRGDIGSTAAAYATAAFERYTADAVTLSPLMGWDSVQPFVTGKYSNKGAFLLCKTSNPGSNDLLALKLQNETKPELLYERIGRLVGCDWICECHKLDTADSPVLLGLVVGATDPVALQKARAATGPFTWILAPGVGVQGGNLEATLRAGLAVKGDTATGVLIPVSRAISQASNPAQAAKDLCDQIRTVRQSILSQQQPPMDTTDSTPSKAACQPYQQEFIQFSLQMGVLKFGSFVLKSGRTSPYFFNAGLFNTGAALYKLGKAYASTIMTSKDLCDPATGHVTFDVIFGPAYKGISLAAVVSAALYDEFKIDVGFAYNRKEAKDHGEGGTLVGANMQHKRVLIVDDVITAGTAIRESYELLQGSSVEATPVGVVTALDRAEIRSTDDRISAVQAVSRDFNNLPVLSIVSLPQLQAYLATHSSEFGPETLESVTAYRKEFGVE